MHIYEIFNLINISVYLIKLCLLIKVRSVEPASITSIYRSYIYVCNWFYISIMVLFERPDENNNTCLCRNFSLWFLKISLRVMSFLKNTTEERQPLNWYSSSQKTAPIFYCVRISYSAGVTVCANTDIIPFWYYSNQL